MAADREPQETNDGDRDEQFHLAAGDLVGR